ncbi:MAG: 5-(carboxyamino)imidazole ribonucleotide mutase [Desulfatiglans sp.]|jgi:phosphoribosylaminoimidazole carboxylase PurE protein|nr:5-(carboxyamino)imidazole ribonucleotide mutase [Thermodesulfobacteriota bacterium]MEE4352624.1 5-(carboxyamino)imidazole ribonucleotide mutase [Desulfatiglans sp.]
MSEQKPLIGVIMGSVSDSKVMEGCVDFLTELEIPHEVKVLSAHRTPELTRNYALTAADRGIEVIIAGAGWAAHLAGVVAAHTILPVIGVPIDSSPLQGLDSLLSTVQMPPGIPVATVALGKGGAKNAAVLASEILALKYPDIAEKLRDFRENLTQQASEKSDHWKNKGE